MAANDRQVAGTHYQKAGKVLQHWDMVEYFGLDYFQGQITKYVMRWRDKGGVQDLKKAQHFLEKYIELQEMNAQEAAHATGSTHTPTRPAPARPEPSETARRALPPYPSTGAAPFKAP